MEPGSSWSCAVKGQEAHFAAEESPTRHKGKREKNVFPVREVKPWKRLSSVVEFPFWEVLKA